MFNISVVSINTRFLIFLKCHCNVSACNNKGHVTTLRWWVGPGTVSETQGGGRPLQGEATTAGEGSHSLLPICGQAHHAIVRATQCQAGHCKTNLRFSRQAHEKS